MKPTSSLKEKILLFLKIFYPLLFSQLCVFATSFIDTIMSGHASSTDLAGVAIGASVWFPMQALFTGILLAITPLVSNMLGANRPKEEIKKLTVEAIYIALLMSAVLVLFNSLFLRAILQMFDVSPPVLEIALNFINYLMIGAVPLFLYTIIRSFFDVHGKTLISMFLSLAILPINILINYFLIFGRGGFPKVGGAGTGIGTSVSYWIILIIAIFILKKYPMFKGYHLFKNWGRPDFTEWKLFFKTGVPIGLSIFFEVMIFSIVTLLMNNFSTKTIAAHQAAMNFSGLLFMVPLSMATALTIAVGYEVGGGRLIDAKKYGKIGLVFSLGFSSISALLLFLFRYQISGLYSSENDVRLLITEFLIYAMIFQFSDGLQATLLGILRGYKDVKPTLYITLFSYLIIGLPIGYIFGTYTFLGAFGYWVGFIVGLSFCALGLGLRLIYTQNKLKKEVHFS